ncbi:MAG TPA: lipid-A-disaccharide synthase [Myxococcota bacterium]|nr:lipid-A-disaccharide synthase [Myxococcota bacterium]
MARVLVSALDASGDLHAADLARALRARRPGLELFGAGGAALRDAGADLVVDQRELAVAGLVEVLEIVPAALRAARRLCGEAGARGATLALLVDSPDFHLPLARRLRRIGVPVLGYIGPNVLRWRRGRVDLVARRFDRLASIFPFEPALYERTGLRVDYVGHPLVEPLRKLRERHDRRSARALLGLPSDGPLLALLPGSRRNEVARMLPLFVQAARALRARRPDLAVAVGLAPSLARAEVEAQLRGQGADLRPEPVAGQSRELLLAADVALAKPGTVTMEAALLGCPLVVAGVAHPLSAALWRRLSRVDTFAMPNLIADAPLVPEFLQRDARPEPIADALAALLEGPARARQQAGFEVVRKRLGDDVAAERAAAIADAMLGD